ncbi:unnamed protein product, partial [Ectocarpus fasciculatus]
SFFHEDFSFDVIQRELEAAPLPEIIDIGDCSLDTFRDDWDSFFQCHNNGSFFKSRRYICTEFATYIRNGCSIFEVGCGYGCTLIPIVNTYPGISYVATDFSSNALAILEKNVEARLPAEHPKHIRTEVLDVVKGPLVTDQLPSRALAVFALSAVDPVHHASAVRNIYDSLEPGGFFLFRDYAIHDMTMYRHKTRFGDKLFQRSDGTLAYYFDVEYVDMLFSSAGFNKIELRYDCVMCSNKRSKVDMKRVFVHAVFAK